VTQCVRAHFTCHFNLRFGNDWTRH
ncbi:hypothetical protein D030_5187B, partial [Vibrio parahaemolyticus AQ3810]